ncbi:MAG: DUF1553 domain-containing protein [Planctomycetes bacterium]|nr:DUF1553 domain-containing protein [Planctomycetota bacterium]
MEVIVGRSAWRVYLRAFGVLLSAAAFALAVGVGNGSFAVAESAGNGGAQDEFFELRVRPLLAKSCFRCHGTLKQSSGLRVDSREALLAGGESGPAIVPGDAEASRLIRAVRREADLSSMPPEMADALRSEQVSDLVKWVNAGAAWPATSPPFESVKPWSLEPLRFPDAGMIASDPWHRTTVDVWIDLKQRQAGTTPAGRADRLELARRISFDLTGLPPSVDEIDRFVHDGSPDAWESLVDRMLASPAYGRKWGRHWLDVVRYADTAGETADYPVPLAWRYRNYVIDSLNRDKRYDEFVREQIAGDILAGDDPGDVYAERVIATGYLAISRRFGFDSENYHHLTIQDTIDTLGQSILGLSLGCARCHDHKFDPISMRDYYALYGIFDSSRYPFPGSEQKQKVRAMAPLAPPRESQPQWRDYQRRVAEISAQLASMSRPVPAAILRSVNDFDGDFELQAPAAGGSNGVLVPPWQFTGPVSITTAAQSPFRNLHPPGRVGVAMPGGSHFYRVVQALRPERERASPGPVFVNLDFRVASAPEDAGRHRILLGSLSGAKAIEISIGANALGVRTGERTELSTELTPGKWHNLQLTFDEVERIVTVRVRDEQSAVDATGSPATVAARAIPADGSAPIEQVVFDVAPSRDEPRPAIEYDNFGLQTFPLEAHLGDGQTGPSSSLPRTDPEALKRRLEELTRNDGDLETQGEGLVPVSPWNPGPNSLVRLSTQAQSPFQNIFPEGRLGLSMPNRSEYDGFGLTIPSRELATSPKLYVSFEFRCADQSAGGEGSWRYYLGQGAGSSAAVELYFNGGHFFQRGADARLPVCELALGQWHQVQLEIDLSDRRYTGAVFSSTGRHEFQGSLLAGWNGKIDYSFIDSYGHIPGVRPALHADNFYIGDQPFAAFGPAAEPQADLQRRQSEIAMIRAQLAALASSVDQSANELQSLLSDGPLEMAYAMAEGTPHAARLQRRGEPDQLGDEVPRGFVALFGNAELPRDSSGSGRLELANWLVESAGPLTARVIVNRVWQYHFGRGLVRTPNDFGMRGMPPTHPELLDQLASEFVRSGWSLKGLHRRILLSASYQQSSRNMQASGEAEGLEALEAQELWHRFTRRRLSAEEIRDAILAVSGDLDRAEGRAHPFPAPTAWTFSQHGPFSAIYDHQLQSVYLMTQRLKRHPFLALFDGADPNATTAERLGTTVPTQALFFLNDPMIHARSESWARRLATVAGDPRTRVTFAWREALGRAPSDTEMMEAMEFLDAYARESVASTAAAGGATDGAAVELGCMAAYLRTLLGSNSFLYID